MLYSLKDYNQTHYPPGLKVVYPAFPSDAISDKLKNKRFVDAISDQINLKIKALFQSMQKHENLIIMGKT